MSNSIYCERCDTHVNVQLRDIHELACGGAGYDPYNSADRFNKRRDIRSEREANEELLSSLLQRQAG